MSAESVLPTSSAFANHYPLILQRTKQEANLTFDYKVLQIVFCANKLLSFLLFRGKKPSPCAFRV